MKRRILLFVSVMAALCYATAWGDTVSVAEFSRSKYEGWTYHRDNAVLSADYISRNNVRLFDDYTLESPVLQCAGLDSIGVDVEYFTGRTNYVASKLALTLELTDVASGESTQTVVNALPGLNSQQMVVMIPVNGAEYKLTLSAPNADTDDNAAVRRVIVNGCVAGSGVTHGDVNGDGVVDVTDVNIIINAMLTGASLPLADINGDGVIDVTDVNAVINLMLSK